MKFIKGLLKTILAGIVAIAILCVIFAPYVFTPVHKSNPNGNTDYIWPGGAVWHKMTEGISSGRFDENGYNNISVVENPDILILGSSHMEAVDVLQTENTAYLLDQLLPDDSVYNLGISGNNFLRVCKYLSTSIALYPEDPEFIIIETDDIHFPAADIVNLLEDNINYTPSYDTGLIASLQRLPFLRLMYLQGTDLLDTLLPKAETAPEPETPITDDAYRALFSYISSATANCSSKIIIVYHSSAQLQADGSVSFESHEDSKALFAKHCEARGIYFVDMADAFTQLYNEENKLPHGFVTGQIGWGHLNPDGHRIMAETLAKTIESIRQEEALCK